MIYNRIKKGFKIAEIWYNNSEIPLALQLKPDIIRCHYMDNLTPNAVSKENLFTFIIDLSQSEEEITKDFAKNTRYEINRGRTKDSVQTETFFSTGSKNMEKIQQYIDFFNNFAQSKKRGTVDFTDYEKFFHKDTLCIRVVRDSATLEALSMHAYIVSDGKARLHQSSSLFRNLDDGNERNRIGRVNRFLHFDDIMYFKEQGISFYDLGGWYGGNDDQQKLAINQFKEAFGGKKKPEYSFIIPVTIKGKLSIIVRKFMLGR